MISTFYEDSFMKLVAKENRSHVMVNNWINSAYGFLSRHIGSKLIPDKTVAADFKDFVRR